MGKSKKEPPGHWQHRPGYNWLTGYKDGTASQKETLRNKSGITMRYIDRSIKTGYSLNK